MESHKSASLIFGSGIEGDRYQKGTGKYSEIEDIREVTLIEIETLEASDPVAIASFNAFPLASSHRVPRAETTTSRRIIPR